MSEKQLSIDEVIETLPESFLKAKFKSIADKFREFLQMGINPMTASVDSLHCHKSGFRNFLMEQSTCAWGFKTYADHLPKIFQHAKTLGWVADQYLSDEWRILLKDAHKVRRLGTAAKLIRSFSLRLLEPKDLNPSLVREWVDQCVIMGEQTYIGARAASLNFEKVLLDRGYDNVNPIRAIRRKLYGKPLKAFPEELRVEVKELLAYRMAPPEDWNVGHPDGEDDDDDDWTDRPGPYEKVKIAQRHQLRFYSAEGLEKIICRLYGFAIDRKSNSTDAEIAQQDIESLKQLFTRDMFDAYKKFLIEIRLVSNRTVLNVFATLIAAGRQKPSLVAPWYDGFLKGMARETIDEEGQRRKERACTPFKNLEQIPGKILDEIARIRKRQDSKAKSGFFANTTRDRQIARLEVLEFLMRWVLALPWPTRNLCECRVSGKNKNILKVRIESEEDLDMAPQWVAELHAKGEGAKFWHYEFSDLETAGCGPVKSTIPECLVKPLVRYLAGARKTLVGKKATSTLFVNSEGNCLQPTILNLLFIEATLKYAQRRICPQIFRDIWALEYLRNPKTKDNYPGLALILWQSDPEKTKLLYK